MTSQALETLASIRDEAENIRLRLQSGKISETMAVWLMRNRLSLAHDAHPWWKFWRK